MKNFNFIDYEITKYKYIGVFTDGLAIVENHDNQTGFINKKGEEVIPCKYQKILPFSCGLAAFEGENGLAGFIDKQGQEIIPCQFKQVTSFSEDLAAFKGTNNLWGFIDKQGNQVIPPTFIRTDKFLNGYAVCTTIDGKVGYVDKEGKFHGGYDWVQPFYDETTFVKPTETGKITTVNKKLESLSASVLNEAEIFDKKYGLSRFIDKYNNHGYVDSELTKKIPGLFYYAREFEEEVAIVEPTKDLIGIVNKEGVTITFSKATHYQKIRDFSCGLAAVQNSKGLWGFIDKKGKEVILCQFIEVDSFSENLAGVLDSNHRLYYINKKGEKKITFPVTYCSHLELATKDIIITAPSNQDLATQKHQILKLARQELIDQINEETCLLNAELESDIYRLTKSKEAE